MNVTFIGKITEMIKHIADLSKTVVETSDPEKYANGVEKLNKGVSDTYEQMRLVIINSKTFSEEEKLQRLEALANQELESKKRCDEAIKGNREQIANIAMEIVKGLLTCGISFIPEVIKRTKLSMNDNTVCLEETDEK